MELDRLDKVNREIVRVFGRVVRERASVPPDVMVTVTRAAATRDLKEVRIGISVYPTEKAEDVLAQLKDQMYDLQGQFNRNINMHPSPYIHLEQDTSAAYADNIERKINELD